MILIIIKHQSNHLNVNVAKMVFYLALLMNRVFLISLDVYNKKQVLINQLTKYIKYVLNVKLIMYYQLINENVFLI